MEAAARGDAWKGLVRLSQERPGFVEDIFRRVEADGAVVAGDVTQRNRPKGTWWDWDDAKLALEYLFWCGRLDGPPPAERLRPDVRPARADDPGRSTWPSRHRPRPTPARGSLLQAAAAMGVATARDLANYHRQKLLGRPAARGRTGRGRRPARPCQVEGWTEPAFLHPGAARPRRGQGRRRSCRRSIRCAGSGIGSSGCSGSATASRSTRRRPSVSYGYYVLPFLFGDQLVARADLKADRQAGALRVHGVFGEPGIPEGEVVEAMAAELLLMARWLELAASRARTAGRVRPPPWPTRSGQATPSFGEGRASWYPWASTQPGLQHDPSFLARLDPLGDDDQIECIGQVDERREQGPVRGDRGAPPPRSCGRS